jgi:pimeloyl-ACP methyl ester carboxylesterase
VTIHYLDWGGTGPPLVLLTGQGDNAHVFDDLAPRLAPRYRVIALTRRGYGQSSHPTSGYAVDSLADDVVAVLDRLRLRRVYVAGHSIAAFEMTRLAVRHPERVARLVYIDGSIHDGIEPPPCEPVGGAALAARGPAARRSALPAEPPADPPIEIFVPPPPTDADLASFAAFVRYTRRNTAGPWTPAREIDLWYTVVLGRDGRVVGQSTDPAVDAAIDASTCAYRMELGAIPVPALAIGAAAGTIFDLFPHLPPTVGGDSLAFAEFVLGAFQAQVPADLAAFDALVPRATTLLIPESDHYVFVRHEARVLAALRDFLPARRAGRDR